MQIIVCLSSWESSSIFAYFCFSFGKAKNDFHLFPFCNNLLQFVLWLIKRCSHMLSLFIGLRWVIVEVFFAHLGSFTPFDYWGCFFVNGKWQMINVSRENLKLHSPNPTINPQISIFCQIIYLYKHFVM